jgi:hypothetical protein
MPTKIQIRRGTASQWTTANPTLSAGEFGLETDTDKVKLGDGETVWTSLAYFSDSFTVSQISDLTASASELNVLDGITASTAELNILDGVTATAAELNVLDGITATTTELNYTDGVTSNIQTQLNSKEATITGGATTITSSNLTASRALLSDGSGKVAVSAVTSTELGYLDGVTSAIQTQLNSKEPIAKTVSNKTANYTIVAADENDIIRSTGGAITITIANVLSIGERIDFLQDGTGQITFAEGSGVTIRSKDSKRKTAARYSGATIICVASGIYHLIGDLG